MTMRMNANIEYLKNGVVFFVGRWSKSGANVYVSGLGQMKIFTRELCDFFFFNLTIQYSEDRVCILYVGKTNDL